MYIDMFNDPMIETLDDKMFSPVHAHMPADVYFPVNNILDGRSGVQLQYGTNEANMSAFFDSIVNWDEVSCDQSGCQKPTPTLFNAKDNGSGSDSDVETAITPVNSSSNMVSWLY